KFRLRCPIAPGRNAARSVVAVGRVTVAATVRCLDLYDSTRAEPPLPGFRQIRSVTTLVELSIRRQSVWCCWASPAAVNGPLSRAFQTSFWPTRVNDAERTVSGAAAAALDPVAEMTATSAAAHAAALNQIAPKRTAPLCMCGGAYTLAPCPNRGASSALPAPWAAASL